jgi:N-acetylmuramoyl-L-alanine amidase
VKFLIALLALVGVAAAAPANEPVATSSLRGKVVVIDPGHNGGNASHPQQINRKVPAGGFRKECDTTGAQTNDARLTEHAFNWDVSQRLKKLLQQSGAKVVLTRPNDSGVGPCINRRAQIGNRAQADAVISLHADGGPPSGRGFHVIHPGLVRGYTDEIVRPSRQLALDVRAALDKAGLRRADYIGRAGLSRRTDIGGLNLSTRPKVLVELGNMRNSSDARKLKSRSWRQSTARALRDSLDTYLGR